MALVQCPTCGVGIPDTTIVCPVCYKRVYIRPSVNTSIPKDTPKMLETTKFARKPFSVDAVQVTPNNLAEIASWVGGEVLPFENKGRTQGGSYVKVPVKNAVTDRQTKALVGDWVLSAEDGGFKVYTQKAFAKNFEQVSTESVMVETPLDVAPSATPVVVLAGAELPQRITPADVAAGYPVQ